MVRSPLTARWFCGFMASALMFTAALTLSSQPAHAQNDTAGKTAESSDAAGNPAPDRLIMRSGKVIDGRILEETDSQITMTVVMGGITAKTTFNKSEIAEIKRGVNAPAAAKADAPEAAAAAPSKEQPKATTPPADEDDPTLTRLYVVELKGRFGWDVSKTTLANLFNEADKELNDLVPGTGAMSGKRVVDPAKRDRNIIVLKVELASAPQFGSIFAAENIAPVVKDQIVDKGRRVIFWVKSATGGAAVFPFVSPEIYFTPDGRLGGVVDLDEFTSGDHMVDEKLISAYIGHAEGFLIKGGYADHLPALRAMLRKHVWLYVKFEGGRPIYLERAPEDRDGDGWTLLSDDGQGDNKDESELEGNDLFLLEPDWAEKLGISDGTVETIDDLAFRLGVHRHYIAVEKNRAQKAVDAWKTGIDEAFKNVNPQERPGVRVGKLYRDLAELSQGGGGAGDANERKRIRGRRINLLNQIRGIVGQYAEVLDADGQWRARIDVEISRLKMEAETDARQQRNQGGR